VKPIALGAHESRAVHDASVQYSDDIARLELGCIARSEKVPVPTDREICCSDRAKLDRGVDLGNGTRRIVEHIQQPLGRAPVLPGDGRANRAACTPPDGAPS
jgi:hypothetical protein